MPAAAVTMAHQQGSSLSSKLEASSRDGPSASGHHRSSFLDDGNNSTGASSGSVARRRRRSKSSSNDSLKPGLPSSTNHSPKATPRRRRKKVESNNLTIEALVSPRGRRVFKRDGVTNDKFGPPVVPDKP